MLVLLKTVPTGDMEGQGGAVASASTGSHPGAITSAAIGQITETKRPFIRITKRIVYAYAYVHAYMHTCVSVCISVCVDICVYIHVHACSLCIMCMHVHACACVCICMHVYMYLSMHMYMAHALAHNRCSISEHALLYHCPSIPFVQ